MNGIRRWSRPLEASHSLVHSSNERCCRDFSSIPAFSASGGGASSEGKEYLDEAWALSGADEPDNRLGDVHTLVRVYTGMAIYHLAVGEYDEVMRYGLIGLSIADRSGYAPWTVHRLLPAMVEALLWKQDFALADHYCKRLRRDSERVGQRIGVLLAESGTRRVRCFGGRRNHCSIR